MRGGDAGLGFLSPGRLVQMFLAGASAVGLWLVGGLDSVPQPESATLVPGHPVDTGAWRVTVERAVLADHLPEVSSTPKPGVRWIGVVLTVDVTGNQTRSDLDRVVHLEAAGAIHPDDFGSAHTFDMADGRPVSSFQPGLPRHVALAWALNAAVAPPDTATIRIDKQTWTTGFATGLKEWQTTGETVSGRIVPASTPPTGSTGTTGSVPAPLAYGREIEALPYRVVIDRISVVDELKGMTHTRPGNRWIGMVVSVRIADPEQVAAGIGGAIRLTVPGRRSATPIVRIGPVPRSSTDAREAVLLWELRTGARVPATAAVEVLGQAQETSPLTGMVRGGDLRTVARGRLPVTDKTSGAASKRSTTSPKPASSNPVPSATVPAGGAR